MSSNLQPIYRLRPIIGICLLCILHPWDNHEAAPRGSLSQVQALTCVSCIRLLGMCRACCSWQRSTPSSMCGGAA